VVKVGTIKNNKV